jgi:predicted MPP superfamily phosphohydrolase
MMRENCFRKKQMMLSITGFFVGIGLLCLNLDLGNRIFGSYRRTVFGAFIRIIGIVLTSVIFMLPFLFLLVFKDSNISLYLYVLCFLFSLPTIVIYIFPPTCKIQYFQKPCIDENLSDIPLAQGIILHKESIEVEFPVKNSSLHFLVLSDLHCNTIQKFDILSKSIRALKTREYDASLILGDLTEKKSLLPSLIQLLSEIKTRYGIYCVRGNHDFEGGRSDYIKDLAEKQSITILSNRSLYISELGITLLGLEYPWHKTPLLAQIKGFAVGLSHTPDNIKLFNELGVAISVAGHTHGGKCRIPFLGAILVPSRYGRFLCQGWFQFQNTLQYITPGIGYFPGQTGTKGEILQLRIEQKKADDKSDT